MEIFVEHIVFLKDDLMETICKSITIIYKVTF